MPRTTTRNQRRQTDFFDVEAEEETATPRSTRRRAPGTEATASITASDLTAMMASLQQSQADNFERILTRVLETRPPSFSPAQASAVPGTATLTPTSSTLPAPGNFATCKARYSGATEESLDGFIDAVEAFKDCANVSESNALRGLSMLLRNDAATWWQGVKATVTTWSDALQNLRSAFGDSRPPHGIYIELFSKPQTLHEKTELFVAKARAQLAHLPSGDLSEKVQLDMIYGLLNQKVRKRLRRDEFSNFNQLLQKARCIEEACAPSSAAAAPSKGAAGAITRVRGAKSPGAADNGTGDKLYSVRRCVGKVDNAQYSATRRVQVIEFNRKTPLLCVL